jgi:hypothetical protein
LVEAFPRLRERIVEHDEGPSWETSAEWTLDAHLATCTVDSMEEIAARMRERLDPELPPWQLCVCSGASGPGLWLRWHHALSDGEGMFALLGALADSEIEPDPDRDLRRLSEALRGEFKPHARGAPRMRAPSLLWRVARQRDTSPRALGSDEFGVLPVLEQVDAPMLARLRARWSVSTNELLIALAAGALARHESRLGRALPSLRVLSPISDRTQHEEVQLGNFSRALRPSVELGPFVPTTAELMARVRTSTREQLERGQAAPYGLYPIAWCSRCPARCEIACFARRPGTSSTTCRGPHESNGSPARESSGSSGSRRCCRFMGARSPPPVTSDD